MIWDTAMLSKKHLWTRRNASMSDSICGLETNNDYLGGSMTGPRCKICESSGGKKHIDEQNYYYENKKNKAIKKAAEEKEQTESQHNHTHTWWPNIMGSE